MTDMCKTILWPDSMVKRGCPLKENLKHFNVVDDFPSNLLHAFWGSGEGGGVCLQNCHIHLDSLIRPFSAHENWSHLRMFLLVIGYSIPEGDQAWKVLSTILYYLSASLFVHLFLPLIMIFCAVPGRTSTSEKCHSFIFQLC